MKAITTSTLAVLLLGALTAGSAAQETPPSTPGSTADPIAAEEVSDGDMALADLLLKKGLISQEEWQGIRDKIEQRQAQTVERTLQRTLQRLAQEPPPTSWSDGRFDVTAGYSGLKITSPDKDFSFNFGGRLLLDAAGFKEGKSDLGNGTEVRRMRMKMDGTIDRVWGYKMEVNYGAGGGSDITDAWVKYGGWESSDVLVGHQKVTFSQQNLTSSNWQLFQERSLPHAFIDSGALGSRRLGVAGSSWGDQYYASAGLFGEGLDDDGKNNEDWGASARVVVAPIRNEDQVLAVGASVYVRDLSSNSNLRFSSRPESHIAGTKLVDTGIITGADEVTMADAELTMINGRFHAEAEYFDVSVGRSGGMSSAKFDGYYAQAGWFLTDDTRAFSMKGAKFGRVKPKGENGAWELAARISSIDLSHRDIRGGREDNMTFGLNWWINPSMAMRFNYVYIHARETAEKLALASSSEHAGAFQVRLQVVF
ncbi:MAG: porin [Planctomycetota bacterium]|nr:MAG: porin [Planctomycetota bacterium]